MLRPQPPEPNQNLNSDPRDDSKAPISGIDIQQELNRLEEMILASFRLPIIGKTLVDEEKLLEQLDIVRLALPEAFAEAMAILENKQEILLEAEEYGQQIVDAAQAKRVQILDESDIIRHAQREAEQLRRQVQQECELLMQQTMEEIDRKRRQCQQELEQMQQKAMDEAEAIERGADEYADSILENIENDMNDILQIIRNGRQQLGYNKQPQRGLPSGKKKM